MGEESWCRHFVASCEWSRCILFFGEGQEWESESPCYFRGYDMSGKAARRKMSRCCKLFELRTVLLVEEGRRVTSNGPRPRQAINKR